MLHNVDKPEERPAIIVALGKNWNHPRIKAHGGEGIAKEMFLSEESKMNVHAAAMTYMEESKKGPAYIICTGGPTSKKANFPPEGGAMKQYIHKRYKKMTIKLRRKMAFPPSQDMLTAIGQTFHDGAYAC